MALRASKSLLVGTIIPSGRSRRRSKQSPCFFSSDVDDTDQQQYHKRKQVPAQHNKTHPFHSSTTTSSSTCSCNHKSLLIGTIKSSESLEILHYHPDNCATTVATAEEYSSSSGYGSDGTTHSHTSVKPEEEHQRSTSSLLKRGSHRLSSLLHPHHHHPKTKIDPLNMGYPGYLTPSEHESYLQFRTVVHSRNDDENFRKAIYCFGEEELEEYALCRWLRARKFVVKDVVTMVEEAMEVRGLEAEGKGFYPDARDALGVEESIFKTQYPQIFTGGHARDGSPLFFAKPGVVNIYGLECITTVTNMHKYQWHSMIHAFAGKLRECQSRSVDGSFQRFQSTVIFDLDGLSRSAVNSKVMDLIKHQSSVDSLCFPESLGRLLIINAPTFFSAIWTIIKRFIDARTSAKVEIYSFRSSAERRMKELIPLDQLPCDYGGTAISTTDAILQADSNVGSSVKRIARRITEVMNLKHHGSINIELKEKEEIGTLRIFTRSMVGAVFTVSKVVVGGHHHHHKTTATPFPGGSNNISLTVKSDNVNDHGNEGLPSEHVLFSKEGEGGGRKGGEEARRSVNICGPGKYKISGDALHHKKGGGGRFTSSSSTEHYLICADIVTTTVTTTTRS